MAESRLRAARLFADSASNMLHVGMYVVGPAFSAHLFYEKPLHDAVSGLTVASPALELARTVARRASSCKAYPSPSTDSFWSTCA